MKLKYLIYILFLTFLTKEASSQIFIGNYYGADSESLNGTFNFEVPFGFPIPLKTWKEGKHRIFVAPYYIFSDTYLKNGWVFDSDGNGNTTYVMDPDPNHVYRQSLASYQTKIRNWTWELRLGGSVTIGKTNLELAYAPQYIQTGSFRRKFIQDNERVRVKDRFNVKADFYNIQRFQHRIYGTFTVYGIGIQAYTNLTSYFKQSTGIDLQKFGLTLAFKFNNFNLDLGNDGDKGKDGGGKEMKQM